MQSLEGTSSKETFAEIALEAVDVSCFAQAELVLVVGLDFTELLDQTWMINVEPSKARQGLGGFLWLARLDEITRCLWQEEHANEDDDGPCELYGDGDSIAPCVVSVLACIADDRCEKETNSDCPLISTNYRTFLPNK